MDLHKLLQNCKMTQQRRSFWLDVLKVIIGACVTGMITAILIFATKIYDNSNANKKELADIHIMIKGLTDSIETHDRDIKQLKNDLKDCGKDVTAIQIKIASRYR